MELTVYCVRQKRTGKFLRRACDLPWQANWTDPKYAQIMKTRQFAERVSGGLKGTEVVKFRLVEVTDEA